MYEPSTSVERERVGFHLKFEGNYEAAVRAYAQEYARAYREKDPYIMDICFQELFDCYLLAYLQADSPRVSPRFEHRRELEKDIEQKLIRVLQENESFDRTCFEKQFSKAWRQFSPRGRGRNPFSVDAGLLVRPRK